jgi:protein-disulfide isomerase
MRMRNVLSFALVTAMLSGCDDEASVDVEGLDRRIELLETQQRESAESLEAYEEKLEEATAHRTALQTALDAQAAQIEELAARVAKDEPTAAVRPDRPDPAARYKVDIDGAHARGPDDAKVTVVIFSDFQCPFCARVQATLRQVETKYGKDVRLVAKHNPLPMHNRAMAAAIAAEAAGRQGKFFEMHDLLYENGRDLTDANFVKWARKIKLDVPRFEEDLKDPSIKSTIEKHQRQATELGARGTPAFFINGRFLSGAQPITSFEKVIDEEVRDADRLIASGTPRSGVYDALMRSAKREL